MALTDAQIKVVIAAELKKAGFDKAARQVSVLERSFKRLGGTILTVFSVRAITQFGKASVRAFADAEREAAQLRTALKALNLEFASPLLNQYVDSLELATGRAGDDLTRAFVTLSSATQDVTTAQSLLNTAMDISAATGRDLQTISVALQRAYKGEVTALARLRIGLTTAELKGKDFDSVLSDLRDRFTGAQAAAADTYAGKIARLGQATEQAREKIGEGFVKGLEDAGVSVVEFQRKMLEMGEAVGQITGTFTAFGSGIAGVFDGLESNRGLRFLMSSVDFISRGMGLIATGELRPSFREADDRRARLAESRRIEALRDQVKAQNNLYKAEQKNRMAADRATKKAERERQALKRAGTIFDMENIQIVAAMQGEIDAQERLRLVALLALNTENAEAAEATSKAVLTLNAAALASLGVTMKAGDNVDTVIKKLLESQAKLSLVALGITNLPKAKNPFEDWDAIIKKILEDLAKIQAGLNFKPGSTATVPPAPVPTPSPIPSVVAPVIVPPAAQVPITDDFPWGEIPSVTPSPNQIPVITPEMANMQGSTGLDNPWVVNVYVQGSVTSEQDLTKTILDNIYQIQSFGGTVNYDLIAV